MILVLMMIAVCVCALRAGRVSDGQVENKELGRAGGGSPMILVLITIAVCVLCELEWSVSGQFLI